MTTRSIRKLSVNQHVEFETVTLPDGRKAALDVRAPGAHTEFLNREEFVQGGNAMVYKGVIGGTDVQVAIKVSSNTDPAHSGASAALVDVKRVRDVLSQMVVKSNAGVNPLAYMVITGLRIYAGLYFESLPMVQLGGCNNTDLLQGSRS